jgi:hypothetical protein
LAIYRIYKISADNYITTMPDVVSFPDDEDVIEYAKTQLNGQGAEVWDGTRVVIRLFPNQKAPSPAGTLPPSDALDCN